MRTKTKTDLNSVINKIDLLDFLTVGIDKKATDSTKKLTLKKFTDLAFIYVADQRDVVLIAVKLK